MTNFHGANQTKSFFEGWYFKHQTKNEIIAFIPGINMDDTGKKSAFIQIITSTNSYQIDYDVTEFLISKDELFLKIGDNIFSEKGIKIDIQKNDLKIKGKILYGNFTPVKYDVMGPFQFIPFIECNHGIISLCHHLSGSIMFNERETNFIDGVGYIEKN